LEPTCVEAVAPARLVRRLTPVLRPLFAWNHAWAMARGLASITALAARAQP